MGMNIISAKDHGEAFLTLETGRAVGFAMVAHDNCSWLLR
jgi:glutamate/aspartate transport system substrate-binding protein